MSDDAGSLNGIACIEKQIEAPKPMLPKQAIVCVGEYAIRSLLKTTSFKDEATLTILIEKSSVEIYKWLPKGYKPQLVQGFEEAHVDTHFWYNVMPVIEKNNSVMNNLQKEAVERLRYAIILSSIWDGIGSASLPTLIGKFKAANMDSLSIAFLPSKIQPVDAHFNAYAALKMCSVTDGATVLLMGRDQVEMYEGVDRSGELIKGNMIVNYLLNIFLSKESLVDEISELSRTFNIKLFTPIVVTGASYKVYGSIEKMLSTALLKPFLKFDLSTALILYVVLRVPVTLADKLPRGKIELAITNWFRGKTNLQSIYIAEPIYTEDLTDRIDAVLFVGGFEFGNMLSDLEQKITPLKNLAVEKGFMTKDGNFIIKVEEKPVDIDVSNAEFSQDLIESPQLATHALLPGTPIKSTGFPTEQSVAETPNVETLVSTELPKIEETPQVGKSKSPKAFRLLLPQKIQRLWKRSHKK